MRAPHQPTAAGSGVVGLITVLLVDEATFRRLVTLIRLIILLLFVLLLLLAVWCAYAHGGEQLLIHYFGRALCHRRDRPDHYLAHHRQAQVAGQGFDALHDGPRDAGLPVSRGRE